MASDVAPEYVIDSQGIRHGDIPVGVLTNAMVERVLADDPDLDMAAITTVEAVNYAERVDPGLGLVVLGLVVNAWMELDFVRAQAIMHAVDFELPDELFADALHAASVRAKIAELHAARLTKAHKFQPAGFRESLRKTRTPLAGIRSAEPRYVAGPGRWE